MPVILLGWKLSHRIQNTLLKYRRQKSIGWFKNVYSKTQFTKEKVAIEVSPKNNNGTSANWRSHIHVLWPNIKAMWQNKLCLTDDGCSLTNRNWWNLYPDSCGNTPCGGQSICVKEWWLISLCPVMVIILCVSSDNCQTFCVQLW